MNPESAPLVPPNQDLAPEAMISEGGAIAQPQIPKRLAAAVAKPHLGRVLGAFIVGIAIGYALGRD